MLRHSKRQRFDALQELECGKGCHAGGEVTYAFATCAKQERRSRRLFDENHVVETAVRLCQRRELASNIGGIPSEAAGVHQQSANQHAVARQELGRRVEHEIGAMVEWTNEPWRGERRVDEQRQSMVVCQRGDTRNVENVETGIAQRFAEQQPCFGPNRASPQIEIARIDECRRNAEPRQRELKQIVRAAIKRAGRDDMRAGAHQRDDCEVQRGLAARRRNRADAILERRDALLQHRARRIGNTRVNVPRALHVEQCGSVIRIGKYERCRLVDRRRACARRRIGHRARMQRQRVELMRSWLGHGSARGSIACREGALQ